MSQLINSGIENKNSPIVLVVDDTPENIDVLSGILQKLGYKIKAALNGEKALQIARRDPQPDIILLDIMMPKIDGYEVCRRLKGDPKTQDIPIIFITAKVGVEDETKGLNLGAVDYITKPLSPPIVEIRVKTHLENHKLNRRLQQSNHFIRKIFGRYMSDEVVTDILDTPQGLELGGKIKEVTIMMTDLRGFTAISENLSPAHTISMLNSYFKVMTQIIMAHKGTIIEFLGDGMLVLFGAPITRDDDSQRGVLAAIEMQLAMEEINHNNITLGFPELMMGCGINTGKVVAGNIGSDLRSKYGVVGSAINLASRIESFTIGGQILISQSTKDACNNLLRIDEQWPERVKGFEEPITVYQVGGIDKPYSRYLPLAKKINFKQVVSCPKVRLTILEGKRAKQKSYNGKITALMPPSAIITTSLTIRRLTNLQIEVFSQNGNLLSDQLYGKVVSINAETSDIEVQFSSIPPAVDQAMEKWLQT
jgi:adenylate cyclase